MSEKRGKGVLMFDSKEPKIFGYLIIGNEHYQFIGERMSDIRTHLEIRKTGESEEEQQQLPLEPPCTEPTG